MVKECAECGKIFESNVHSQKTCSPGCAAIRRKKQNEERYAKARAATRERNGIRICLNCGKDFVSDHALKVCCSRECQHERDKRKINENNRSIRQKSKAIRSTEKQIIDINAKARALGMSYGQYVARYGG